jgi:urease accessory protein
MSLAITPNTEINHSCVALSSRHQTSINSPATDSSNSLQWQAKLKINIAKTKRGSVVKRSEHIGPLYIQKAFYPQGPDLAHIYILHPPGGLVSGDHLDINIHVSSNAKALITTPGAGRVYKARSDKSLQQQQVTLEAEDNAVIEWLPLETILYPNANTRLNTLVKLSSSAFFIGWDISCLGLPANGQVFDKGCLEQCLQIEVAGKIKLRERLIVNDSNRDVLSHRAGFANRSVNALMVAGPFNQQNTGTGTSPDSDSEQLIEKLRQHSQTLTTKAQAEQALCSISQCAEFLLIRYLGDDSEQARWFFSQCWQDIRPQLLGIAACAPRIWST